MLNFVSECYSANHRESNGTRLDRWQIDQLKIFVVVYKRELVKGWTMALWTEKYKWNWKDDKNLNWYTMYKIYLELGGEAGGVRGNFKFQKWKIERMVVPLAYLGKQ